MNMKLNCVLVWFLSSFIYCAAQTPINDASWLLNPSLSDDFNGSTLNTVKWRPNYPWNPPGLGQEYVLSSNIIFTGTSLKLRADKYAVPINVGGVTYYYNGSAISSKFNLKYGYIEMEAKIPSGYLGYWSSLWMYGELPAVAPCALPVKSEIDIHELGVNHSAYTNRIGLNYHWLDSQQCQMDSYSGHVPDSIMVNADTRMWHKYACLWEVGKMSFYFDDVLIKTIVDPIHTPSMNLEVLLDFAITPASWKGAPNQNTVFPAFFEINYLNIYKLQQNCSLVENICAFNPFTYSKTVKKSVTIAGAGCTSSINLSDNITLRATDFVQLNEGALVSASTSGNFAIEVMPCPN